MFHILLTVKFHIINSKVNGTKFDNYSIDFRTVHNSKFTELSLIIFSFGFKTAAAVRIISSINVNMLMFQKFG